MRITFARCFVTALLVSLAPPAWAATCAAGDFAAAVDQSGASLRNFTLETQPKLQAAMRRYREALKLDEADYQNAALDAIQDSTLESLDAQSSELIVKVDSLGRVPEGSTPDCAKLDEIKAASAELLAVIKKKSAYMQAKLDEKIAAVEKPVRATKQQPDAAKAEPENRNTSDGAGKARPPAAGPGEWAASTKANDAYVPPPEAAAPQTSGGAGRLDADGYTIDEIQEATRGFFGTVSTSLASVIEHAFQQSGRPTAYVLGTEGGGAFLAGLRYGEGTLYLRNASGTRKVYWHGPSLGTDLGASGARTMFLIYRMHQPEALYRSFTGVDGSAFFVGGVGVTLLKGGDVLMAPIRSGIGLRLGANLGYVKFTEQPTWNPF